jgi:hypothetical protein
MVSPDPSAVARFIRRSRGLVAVCALVGFAFWPAIPSPSTARSFTTAVPQILLDLSGPEVNQAAALESVFLLRDPFHVRSSYPGWTSASDQNTRVAIFVSNVTPGFPVSINLVDAQGQSFGVPAEAIVEVQNSDFLQVVFRLPDNVAPGACNVNVSASTGVSNSASFRVALETNHWRQDLQLLATQLKALHVNPFTKISRQQFDNSVADLDRDIPVLQDHEIVTRMMQIVASIGDAHTSLSVNGSRLRFRSYPIKTYWFTDGLYVTSVGSAYPQALGKRVTNIGKSDSNQANTQVATVISHENDVWVKAQAPSQFASPETLQGLRLVQGVQSGAFVMQETTGESSTVNIDALFANQPVSWLSLPDPANVPTPLYRQHPELNYWFDYVDGSDTVYFQYNVCQNRADLPFNQFLQQMQQFFGTHQVNKFVIDLRNNTGGDSSILQPLINGLANDPNFNSSDRLFVIIGRLTISSGLLNAISLRQQTQATFVGEATGGKPNHFGEVGSFRLSNSRLLVSYSKKFFTTVPGDPASLFPDTTIELASRDYFAGRDPVMENILNR